MSEANSIDLDYLRMKATRNSLYRADCQAFKKWARIIDPETLIALIDKIDSLQERVKSCEAELKEVKEEAETQVRAWSDTYDRLRIRAENKQRRLEAELAKRPVVYCLRNAKTGRLEKTGQSPDVYTLQHAKQWNPDLFIYEPYEGQTS